jgi:hypothetical protein
MRKLFSRLRRNRLSSGFRPQLEILDQRLQPGNAMWNPPLDPIALLATLDQAGVQSGTDLTTAPSTFPAGEGALGGFANAPANTVSFPALAVVATADSTFAQVPPAQLDPLPPGGGPDIPPPDDTLNMGILPGSSLVLPGAELDFGDRPPTSGLYEVQITDDGTGAGTLFISQSNITIQPVVLEVGHQAIFQIQLLAQSDAAGTYDRNTGEATIQVALNLVIYSPNEPGFDNSGSCAVPATEMSFDTSNPGGSLFLNGDGTVVDNTFVMDRLPHGACGSHMDNEYSDLLSKKLGLPSMNTGDNTMTLHLHMRPAIGPFS